MFTRHLFLSLSLACLTLVTHRTGAENGGVTPRPYTVADGVAMRMLTAPSADFPPPEVDQWSSDRKHFFAVTSRGDIGRNQMVSELWLFTKLGSGAAARLDAGKLLLQMGSATNYPGIWQVSWSGNDHLLFVGSDGEEPGQVYAVDLTGGLEKLTAHRTAVVGFSATMNREMLVIQAEKPPSAMAISRGIPAGTSMAAFLEWNGQRSTPFTNREYFGVDVQRGHETRVAARDYVWVTGLPVVMSISPDGRFAEFPELRLDRAEYWSSQIDTHDKLNQPKSWGEKIDRVDARMLPIDSSYAVADLVSGSTRTIIEAPIAFQAGIQTKDITLWAPDSRSVLVANSYAPTDAEVAGQSPFRKAAVIEYSVDSGKPRVVAWAEHDQCSVTDLSFDAKGLLQVTRVCNGKQTRATYAKTRDIWIEQKTSAARELSVQHHPMELHVDISQSVNVAPELRETNNISGVTRIVTDLNPQFRDLTLGEAEIFKWQANGHLQEGLLLKPIGYERGKRYPLVVQTHGVKIDRFWLNGGYLQATSGYAARALANRGFIVVQVPDSYDRVGEPAEIDDALSVCVTAVDALVAAGVADPSRVGIHGNSRSGYWVQAALLDPRHTFAAGSVAEANEVSREEYTNASGGVSYSSMAGLEHLYGVPPLWGPASATAWAERDPINHLDRMHAALLIEAYSTFWGEWWDTFAILRRHGRPVDYLYFPGALHAPYKAVEKLWAQGSVVDWYDFWLNNHEDPDAAKVEQYARWRELRERRDAVLKMEDEEKAAKKTAEPVR
jgi:dipeptidyl aminopeptidase/acylaminoacyl peptidase